MKRLRFAVSSLSVLSVFLWLGAAEVSIAQEEGEVPKLVYLIVDGDKLIASNIKFNRFDEIRLQAQEFIRQQGVGDAVIAVVTNKRVLGYSVYTATWRARGIEPDEEFIELSAEDYSALIVTSKRFLSFNGKSGVWAESARQKIFR